ncbi:hypothetical protein [Nocardioides sp. 503]|uniref:hypothetical protein n=1 Tax=Nocardioides sp. 503 TaxID=2508326 RepID=UPI0010703548|nr:hypothetical protein [Nocardioides sp. 503]
MTSEQDHEPDRSTLDDTTALQLAGALVCALALVFPLRGALGASSGGWLFLWVIAAVALTALVGRLLEAGGVPRPFGTVLVAAAVFALVTLAGLTFVGLLGDPGNDNQVSVVVGVPAAALAAAGAVAILSWRRDDDALMFLGVGSFVLTLFAAGTVGGLVHEARDDAADARILEAASLEPFVPEIAGLEARYSGPIRTRAEGGGPVGVTGYELRYRQESPPGDDSDAAYVTIEVRLDDDSDCEPSEGISSTVSCDEGDGYVVETRDGELESVTAGTLGLELLATFTDGDGEVPSPEEVGQAMAKAEIGEWDDVVELDEE